MRDECTPEVIYTEHCFYHEYRKTTTPKRDKICDYEGVEPFPKGLNALSMQMDVVQK